MTRAPLTDDARRFLNRFGEAIRDLRREAGWMQEQLATRAGMPPNRVGEIERGRGDTSLSRLWTLARALRVAPSVVLRRMELAADPAAVDEIRDRLRDALRRLDAADLDLVAAIVRRLMQSSKGE